MHPRHQSDKAIGAEAFQAGSVSVHVIQFFRERGLDVQSTEILLTRNRLDHLRRPAKRKRGAGLSDADIEQLPDALARPKAVLFDTESDEKKTLLYVFESKTKPGKLAKIAVRVEYKNKIKLPGETKRRSATSNFIRTAGYAESHNLSPPRYVPIEGAL